MGLIQEFREFAVKGNAVDLAVGIIIGAAFGSVVNSLVNDIIMPPIGMALGHTDFAALKIVLSPADLDAAGKVIKPEAAIRYGAFINNLVNFLIIAFCVFLVVKVINRLRTGFGPWREQPKA